MEERQHALGPFFTDHSASALVGRRDTVFVFVMTRIVKIAQRQLIFPRIIEEIEMIGSSKLHQFSVCPIHLPHITTHTYT